MESAVAMSPADAADLGRSRRGIEPLRIVVMPQHPRQDGGSCARFSAPSDLFTNPPR